MHNSHFRFPQYQKQELENIPGTYTQINLLDVLRSPREASTAPPFAYINSRAVSRVSHLRYQSWVSKFQSPNAPFSPENVFLPSDQSPMPEDERRNSASATTATVAQLSAAAAGQNESSVQPIPTQPRETIVELPPLPAKTSVSQSERVAEFLKQIPDLSYMLSSKVSQPSS